MKQMAVGLAVLLSMSCSVYEREAPRSSSTSTRGMQTGDVRSTETTTSKADQGGIAVFDAAAAERQDAVPARASSDAGDSRGARAGSPQSPDSSGGGANAAGQRAGSMQKASAGGATGMRTRDAGDAASAREPSDPSHDDAGTDAAGSLETTGTGARADAGATTKVAMNSGSCCSPSDQPGCGDAQLQACVCMHKPSCCSAAWDAACTRIIAEKFCQSGVRECVCGSGTGQWQQAQCCETSWDDTCSSVATNKCGATADCR